MVVGTVDAVCDVKSCSAVHARRLTWECPGLGAEGLHAPAHLPRLDTTVLHTGTAALASPRATNARLYQEGMLVDGCRILSRTMHDKVPSI